MGPDMNARIRVATENDAVGIQAIYAPIVKHSPISFEIEVPSISEIQARIHKTLVQYPWIVCELNQKIIGYAYGSAFRLRPAYQWSAEVSVRCLARYWVLAARIKTAYIKSYGPYVIFTIGRKSL